MRGQDKCLCERCLVAKNRKSSKNHRNSTIRNVIKGLRLICLPIQNMTFYVTII
ncbi:unnamed protein product [Paramecium octaurelia]|uniref:Uncharacterized protein n=1 Tax=Paramecium octaurelia TaxID=43137 RepID=A0A8S1WVH7_PAROT|nr:unnamed protein product [Paramecium octaurelia]